MAGSQAQAVVSARSFPMHPDPAQRQHRTWVGWGWAGAEGKGTGKGRIAGNKDTAAKQGRKMLHRSTRQSAGSSQQGPGGCRVLLSPEAG